MPTGKEERGRPEMEGRARIRPRAEGEGGVEESFHRHVKGRERSWLSPLRRGEGEKGRAEAAKGGLALCPLQRPCVVGA
jgi:hypothetical protein